MMQVKGHRLLIKPVDVKEQDQEVIPESLKIGGFQIAKDVRTQKMEEVGNERGILVQIGSTAWKDPALGGEPWAEVGDEILFARYAGKLREDPYTGEKYFIINDVDLQVVLTKE